MDRDIPTIEDTATVTKAAEKMTTTGKGHLAIFKAGQLIGIITENDIVKKVVAQKLDPNKTLISQIMFAPLVTIDPDEDLLGASKLMQEHNFHSIAVVREGIIYGIITARGIAIRCGEYFDKSVKDLLRFIPHRWRHYFLNHLPFPIFAIYWHES